MSRPKIFVITGPTAAGKTSVGALLSKEIGGEVVSADSMQIYNHMEIGTAAPSKDERLGITHHMIGVVDPRADYSVACYVSDASKCVDDILGRGISPVIVGGTGLYIESLLSGREFSAYSDVSLRKSLEDEYDIIGGDAMLQKLCAFDPQSAAKLHSNDKKRIIRAFEVFKTVGKTISQHDIETKSLAPRYHAVKIAITFSDRAELYERINSRVDYMIASGLEQEVRALLAMGVKPGMTAMQAIGYKEMVCAISGEMTMDEAIDVIKMESRRYAKRQLSWLRRDQSIQWIPWDKFPDAKQAVAQILSENF